MLFWRKSERRNPQVPLELYKNLKMNPVDPNRAKFYAWGLCCIAAFIAMYTFRSNFDYFLEYYTDWGLKTRLAVFLGVEAFLILAPLTYGYGNRMQKLIFFVGELIIIPLLFYHGYLVSDSLETRKQAEGTKAAAVADLNRERAAVDAIAAKNNKAQEDYNIAMRNYNLSMARYERLAQRARKDGVRFTGQLPIPPDSPELIQVPKVDDGLLKNSSLSVNEVVHSRVDHTMLRAIQFIMLLIAVAGATGIIVSSDAMRVRGWFVKYRDMDIKETMQSQAPYLMLNPPAQPYVALPQTQRQQQQPTSHQMQPARQVGFVTPVTPITQRPTPSYTVNAPQNRPNQGNLGNL